MKSPRNPAPGLIRLLSRATVISEIHGIPVETVLIHWLALASTVLGDLVESQPYPSSEPIKAKIPLLLLSCDAAKPWWAACAIQVMQGHQDAVIRSQNPRVSIEEAVKKLEQRKRAMIALGHREQLGSGGPPDPELIAIDRLIRFTKNHRYYKHLHAVGSRSQLSPPVEGITCSVVADGLKHYLRILGTRCHGDGLAAAISRPASVRSNLVGWVSERDLQRLAKQAGGWFPRFGWIVSAPAADGSKREARLPVPVDEFLERLAIMRLSAKSFSFSPHRAARDFLYRQVEEVRQLTDTLPPEQRMLAVPDPHLAWQLSALLAVIAGETFQPELTLLLCCRLGSFLASRLIRHHVHRFRRLFPADEHGAFTGLDLNVVRSLTREPKSIRQFQRRLRDVSKTRCLVALHRACDAGFAVSPDGKRFQIAPEPPTCLGLAAFLSEMNAATAFPGILCLRSADSTDKGM